MVNLIFFFYKRTSQNNLLRQSFTYILYLYLLYIEEGVTFICLIQDLLKKLILADGGSAITPRPPGRGHIT